MRYYKLLNPKRNLHGLKEKFHLRGEVVRHPGIHEQRGRDGGGRIRPRLCGPGFWQYQRHRIRKIKGRTLAITSSFVYNHRAIRLRTCCCGSMVEHFTRNEGVASSILASSSKRRKLGDVALNSTTSPFLAPFWEGVF